MGLQTLLVLIGVAYSSTVSMPNYFQSLKFGHEREVEDEFQVGLKYGVEPQLLKAVLKVESELNHKAVNPYTLDYGIGQINYKTAEAYGIDTERLISDRAYSIDRAAFVLSKFQQQFASREPKTWVRRYNCGTARKFTPQQEYKCEIYLRKIKIAYGPSEI